jgi:RluA family pseudouridine synthase
MMSLQKMHIRVEPSCPAWERGRLDRFLAKKLPLLMQQPLSKSLIRKWILVGAVYLNGKRIRIASKPLNCGALVEVYFHREKLTLDLEGSRKKHLFDSFLFEENLILFEDEDLIVVQKPAGLPTQPTLDNARLNLYDSIKKFLATRTQTLPAQVYLGLHHRLDRDTSGVILFTKRKSANLWVSRLFSERLLLKTYQALAYSEKELCIAPSWTVKNYLNRCSSTPKAKFRSVNSGGKWAHTDFILLGQAKKTLWIQAHPFTGRTHQIRVHLSELDMPIVGDFDYGSKKEAPRVMLHASQIQFSHPKHSTMVINSALPADFSKLLEKHEFS